MDSWPLLALSIFSKPLALTQSVLGGQLHVKHWISWMVALGMTPAFIIWKKASFCLPPGVSLPSDCLVLKKGKEDVAMYTDEQSDSGAESGWSDNSGNSSTDSEGTLVEVSSVASDQDRFDIAYEAFHGLSDDLYTIDTTQPARGVTSDDAPGVIEK